MHLSKYKWSCKKIEREKKNSRRTTLTCAMWIKLYNNDLNKVREKQKKKNTKTKNKSVKRNANEMCDQNFANKYKEINLTRLFSVNEWWLTVSFFQCVLLTGPLILKKKLRVWIVILEFLWMKIASEWSSVAACLCVSVRMFRCLWHWMISYLATTGAN